MLLCVILDSDSESSGSDEEKAKEGQIEFITSFGDNKSVTINEIRLLQWVC